MHTMAKPNKFKELDRGKREQQIIDVATELFHQEGYRATTLDHVASKLGISKAALYHYVSSKEDLLSRIYLQALESFFASAYEIGRSEQPPREKLRSFIRNHIENIIVKNLAMFGVFFSEEHNLPPKDRKKIRREKRKYTKVVEDILAEGMAQGDFASGDPRLTAFAIIGMCSWLYKWYQPGKGRKDAEAIGDMFIALLEDGMLARGVPGGSTQASSRRTVEQLKSKLGQMSDLIDRLDN